jgi:GT2 family glycosyltransferase
VKNIALARNILLEKARGDILIFIDSDVLVPPWFVETHVQTHIMHPEVDILSSTVLEINKLPELDELMKLPKPDNVHIIPAKKMADFVQMALSLKRRVACAVKYDTDFAKAHEDGYYFHAALKAGLKTYKTLDIIALHYKPVKKRGLIDNVVGSFRNASFPLFFKKFGLWYLKANIGHAVKFCIRMSLIISLVLAVVGEIWSFLMLLAFYYIVYPSYRRRFDPYILLSELATGLGEIRLITSCLIKRKRS